MRPRGWWNGHARAGGHPASLLPLCLVTFAACGDADARADAAAEPVVRDSAGITIVENTDPLWTEDDAWRLSDEPVLEIGMMDGPEAYQFHRITGVRRLADGRVAVANAGTHQIRLYDADGRHLRSLGGEGGGPGEFTMLSSIGVTPGDTIFAYDAQHGRLSVFDPGDGFVEAYSLPGGMGPGAGLLGRADDGSFVLAAREGAFSFTDSSEDITRDAMTYLRWWMEGKRTDTLRAFRGSEQVIRTRGAGSGRMTVEIMRAPFMRGTYNAVEGGRLFHGEAEAPEVVVTDLSDDREARIRWAGELLPVSDSYMDAVREQRRRQMRESGGTDVGGDPFAETPRPPNLPVYSAIHAGGDGTLWISRFGWPGADVVSWDIFDADGRWLGSLELPARLRIMEIAQHRLLGVYRDDFEVEYVRMYELIKPEAAS